MMLPPALVECCYPDTTMADLLHDVSIYARALPPGKLLRIATNDPRAIVAIEAWCQTHNFYISARYGDEYQRVGGAPQGNYQFDIQRCD